MTGSRCARALRAGPRILACAVRKPGPRRPITQLSANRPSYYYNIDANMAENDAALNANKHNNRFACHNIYLIPNLNCKINPNPSTLS